MSKIRVLIVDDAVVVRKIISTVLSQDPELEVVGVAPNGAIAIQKITQVNPDVITMDMEMPDMNGIQTIEKIRAVHAELPILMFTSATERGAQLSFEALAKGASEFIVKPSNMKDMNVAMEYIRINLIPKIKAVCAKTIKTNFSFQSLNESAAPPVPVPSSASIINRLYRAVVIGISTGGPNALAELVPNFPSNFPVPIFIVQHMPPVFTKSLAGRLSTLGPIQFKEGMTGDIPEPGKGYIAPGDFHMVVESFSGREIIRTHQGPPENSCRPAADVLFRSAADVYGPSLLGVVMTGMGQDGLRGCQNIRDKNGIVFVQDEASSVVWSMPGSVYGAGLADKVVSLKSMANEIVAEVSKNRGMLKAG